MGNTYEVYSYQLVELDKYEDVLKYAGEDYDEAITIMKELKETDAPCVTLIWR